MKHRPVKPKLVVRVNYECLVGAPVREVFNSPLKRIIATSVEVGDMELEWVIFKTSIVEVAAQFPTESCWCLLL